jgi:hypothetical protein
VFHRSSKSAVGAAAITSSRLMPLFCKSSVILQYLQPESQPPFFAQDSVDLKSLARDVTGGRFLALLGLLVLCARSPLGRAAGGASPSPAASTRKCVNLSTLPTLQFYSTEASYRTSPKTQLQLSPVSEGAPFDSKRLIQTPGRPSRPAGRHHPPRDSAPPGS